MAINKSFIREFLQKETLGGLCLIAAMIVALIWANTSWGGTYRSLWVDARSIELGFASLHFTLKDVINDGLMSVFFLLIGCELKRERVEGELSSPSKVRLPIIAAIGGMAIPALIYVLVALLLNASGDPNTVMRGWAVPTATDIAFALGVLSFLGKRVPQSLKTFLMALAVIDDLGAIILIGLFYTAGINLVAFLGVIAVLSVLLLLNRLKVTSLFPYLVMGMFLWFAMHASGIHATLSGVLLAFFIPISSDKVVKSSPLKTLEHALHPFVVFGIMPLFALANAGVPFEGLSFDVLLNPVTLGVMLGLIVGKPVGVYGASLLARKVGWVSWPKDIDYRSMAGAAMLCGIGFTMSLFIGSLAFSDDASLVAVRLGVLSGSMVSAVLGSVMLLTKARA